MSDDRPTSPPMGEFGRIARLFRPLAAGFAGAFDLTDDAAVFAVPPGREVVATTDAMVENVHFLPDDPPEDVAAKLLRVNLSDLAAMGADPLTYSLTVCLPRRIDDAWVARFAEGLADDQARFGLALSGGDSVRTEGPVVLTVTALGTVPAGCAVRRSGARIGDRVLVTGTIGDAHLGLRLRLGTLTGLPEPVAAALVTRLRRPSPRTVFAAALRNGAAAAADVSDGLVADLGHVATASGVAMVIEADRVPRSDAARAVLALRPDLWPDMLGGGDDYELALTARPDAVPALLAAARALDLPLTEIGACVDGPPGRVEVRAGDGTPLDLASTGWTHA